MQYYAVVFIVIFWVHKVQFSQNILLMAQALCFQTITQSQGYLLKPFELPSGHPDCDRYFDIEEIPYDDFPTLYFDHPDIHEAYRQGKPLPPGHPSVNEMVNMTTLICH